jgi:hypothetical protein
LTRVPVIVHERLGLWAGQLRARLHDRPIRWFETRSAADLDNLLTGLSSPVVLIDLRKNVPHGLHDLELLFQRSPAARVLVLDPDSAEGARELARELGAMLVISGFAPPPEVAGLIDRCVALAAAEAARQGWSRPLRADSPFDPDAWLESTIADGR